MSRLSPNTKKWLLIGICALIFVFIFGFGFSRQQTTIVPPPQHMTFPPEPTYDKNDPNFVSPYNHDNRDFGALMPVWKDSLIVDGIQFTVTSQPDVPWVTNIDAEDVVTITMPRQRFATDASKAKIIAVLHDDMTDPYTTAVSNYKAFCLSPFVANEDGTWAAKFMFGYDIKDSTIANILFIYDNNVEYYTMVRLTKNNVYSKQHYQWLFPDKQIAEMQFICDEQQFTFCYCTSETTTLSEWVSSDTNHAHWVIAENGVYDPTGKWYIDSQYLNTKLSDGVQFTLLPVK